MGVAEVIAIISLFVAAAAAAPSVIDLRDRQRKEQAIKDLYRILDLQRDMISIGKNIVSEVEELFRIRESVTPYKRKYSNEIRSEFIDVCGKLLSDVSKQKANLMELLEVLNTSISNIDSDEMRSLRLGRLTNAQRLLDVFVQDYIQYANDVAIGKKDILDILEVLLSDTENAYRAERLIVKDGEREFNLRDTSERKLYILSAHDRLRKIEEDHDKLIQMMNAKFGPQDVYV